MKLAIIMRGLPGSGKSFWVEQYISSLPSEQAKLIRQQGYCSTDSYFYVDGHYCFDRYRLNEYHQRNLAAFISAMTTKIPVVICDNTNLARWEYLCYETAAKALGYQVKILLIGQPDNPDHQKLCAKRNSHCLSLTKIRAMAAQFEAF